VDVSFRTERLQRQCNDTKALRREYGADGEKRIRQRLDELADATTLSDIRALPAPRCEELKGDRQGQLSVRVHGGYRLIFEPAGEAPRKEDGGLDWTAVTAIQILEITDYHD
jgi:proteic killer suppression protein